METRKLLSSFELPLRRELEKFMRDTYNIQIGTRTEERIIFDFHEPVNPDDPQHACVFLKNSRVGYCDIVGFLEFDYVDFEFVFYPKRGATKTLRIC